MTEQFEKKRKLYGDLLEVFILFALIFMTISIYVPRAIWDEEESFESQSRFNMENQYHIQQFYHSLLDRFDTDGLWAMKVVNSVRDSLTGDSTYLGEQSITLGGKDFTVNVPKGYDIDFDTTFGFPMMRRDTILDTTVTVVMFLEELSRNDTTYIQYKHLHKKQANPNFISALEHVETERVEVVNYYDSYMPDSSMYFCPVSDQSYLISIKEEDNIVRVDSPIEVPVVEPRYLVFSFEAENHGFINDGSRSWDR